jgi:pyruvate kinase
VSALVIPHPEAVEDLVQRVDHELLERRLARVGDLAVMLGGTPVGVPGTTNLIKIHRLGSTRGRGGGSRK